MLVVILFAAVLIGCTVGVLWFGIKAYKARGAQAVTVPASASPGAIAGGFTLLGLLAAIGVKWADVKRKRQERK